MGSWFDWLVLLFLCWSGLRGWRRGFYPEFYSLLTVVLLLALLAGFSLTQVVWGSLDRLLHDYLWLSRLIGGLLLVFFTLYLLWKIRTWLSGLRKRRSRSSVFGLLAGLGVGVLWVGAVLVCILPFETGDILYSFSARLWRPLVGLVLL